MMVGDSTTSIGMHTLNKQKLGYGIHETTPNGTWVRMWIDGKPTYYATKEQCEEQLIILEANDRWNRKFIIRKHEESEINQDLEFFKTFPYMSAGPTFSTKVDLEYYRKAYDDMMSKPGVQEAVQSVHDYLSSFNLKRK